MTAMTSMQAIFVDEYLIDLNATRAAIRAGYSEATAYSQGQRLLKNVEVASAIKAALDERAERTLASADAVLLELQKLAFANVLDFAAPSSDGSGLAFDFSTLSRDQAAAFAEITTNHWTEGKGDDARIVHSTKVKLADKRASLNSLYEHLTGGKKLQLGGMDGKPIKVDDTSTATRLASILAAAQARLDGAQIEKEADDAAGSPEAG